MTTIRQIISDAYREAGIIPTGGEPSAAEHAEGLRRLQNIYDSLFGNELGEGYRNLTYGRQGLDTSSAKFEDASYYISSNYVPNNTRLMLRLEAADTIYLHPNPRDGSRLAVIDSSGNLATYNITLDGNGREIEDAETVTLSTDGLSREWFYRADLGNWTRISDLTADAENPLPSEFDDYLITLLSFRINPRFGAETSANTMEVLKRMQRQFRARYRQVHEQESEAALIRLTAHGNYWYNSTTDTFDRGK